MQLFKQLKDENNDNIVSLNNRESLKQNKIGNIPENDLIPIKNGYNKTITIPDSFTFYKTLNIDNRMKFIQKDTSIKIYEDTNISINNAPIINFIHDNDNNKFYVQINRYIKLPKEVNDYQFFLDGDVIDIYHSLQPYNYSNQVLREEDKLLEQSSGLSVKLLNKDIQNTGLFDIKDNNYFNVTQSNKNYFNRFDYGQFKNGYSIGDNVTYDRIGWPEYYDYQSVKVVGESYSQDINSQYCEIKLKNDNNNQQYIEFNTGELIPYSLQNGQYFQLSYKFKPLTDLQNFNFEDTIQLYNGETYLRDLSLTKRELIPLENGWYKHIWVGKITDNSSQNKILGNIRIGVKGTGNISKFLISEFQLERRQYQTEWIYGDRKTGYLGYNISQLKIPQDNFVQILKLRNDIDFNEWTSSIPSQFDNNTNTQADNMYLYLKLFNNNSIQIRDYVGSGGLYIKQYYIGESNNHHYHTYKKPINDKEFTYLVLRNYDGYLDLFVRNSQYPVLTKILHIGLLTEMNQANTILKELQINPSTTYVTQENIYKYVYLQKQTDDNDNLIFTDDYLKFLTSHEILKQ